MEATKSHTNGKDTSEKNKKIKAKCEICDKTFSSNGALRKHFDRIHNLKETYQCNVCSHLFNQKVNLKKHIDEVHKNIKKHICESCKKHFLEKSI